MKMNKFREILLFAVTALSLSATTSLTYGHLKFDLMGAY